jgi:hypothetical protein
LEKKGYIHDRRSQRAASARGENPGALLPGVHRIASLAKRWLLGTHQGAVDAAHLPSYLNEFVFRFNRRRSRSRGLLFTPKRPYHRKTPTRLVMGAGRVAVARRGRFLRGG